MKTVQKMWFDLHQFCNSKYDCTGCPMENDGVAPNCYPEPDDSKVLEWHKKCFPQQYQNDPVNHPAHYTNGKIEVADFIADQRLNFDRGNAVKYLCRAGMKDPACEIQDLEKANWYIKHEIKTLKERNNDRN